MWSSRARATPDADADAADAEPTPAAGTRMDWPTADGLQHACGGIPGLPIAEASVANINYYSCGSFSLIERDVRTALQGHASAAEAVLAVLRRLQVPLAFDLRIELVNLKKCAYHVFAQTASLERQLSQLATFFHHEHTEDKVAASASLRGRFFLHTERLSNVSDARTRARGAAHAAHDARALAKQVCSLPRHPSKGAPAVLSGLPETLHSWRALLAAEEALRLSGAPLAAAASSGGEACSGGEASSWYARAQEGLACTDWPAHVLQFVRTSLLVRGADKALRMRDATDAAIAALEATLMRAEAALSALRALPSAESIAEAACAAQEAAAEPAAEPADAELVAAASGLALGASRAKESLALAMRRRKGINSLVGLTSTLRDTMGWLRQAQAAAEAGVAAFVAGDGRGCDGGGRARFAPALCVPSSVALEGLRLLAELRGVEQRYRAEMRAEIAARGWPPALVARTGIERARAADNKVCSSCARQLSALWVHRGVCCECEAAVRDRGICPFGGPKCDCAQGRRWWCAHDARCIVCDEHSCASCRLERGGADVVVAAAARLAPARVALDFDRTLCNTKSGGRPSFERHSLDEELLTLMHVQPCAVVTRNQHVDAIRELLARYGAPADVPVLAVPKHISKAAYVRRGLGEAGEGEGAAAVLLVDDSIAELCEPSVADDPNIHRVLFVRAMG